MADIRINALATTAASTASDDFIAVDGSANGTRKLNAFSPTFGGNLTVSGTGTSSVAGVFKAGTDIVTGDTSAFQVHNNVDDKPMVGFYRGGTLRSVLRLNTDNDFRLLSSDLSTPANLTAGNLTVSGGTITGGTSGMSLDSGGTNQNITLTPSGTGSVSASGAGTSASTARGIFHAVNTSSQTYNAVFSGVSPNLTATQVTTIGVGVRADTNDSGYMGFRYAGAGSTNNRLVFGFYGNDQLMSLAATGNLLIGTTSDGGQKLQVIGTAYVSGALTTGGNINLANAFFLNGRNAANTADVPIVRVSASDVLSFGEGGYNATFAGKVTVNGTDGLLVNNSASLSLITIGEAIAGSYSRLNMRTGSNKYAWSIAAQDLVDNALTITPSTAVGGTTFTTPVLTVAQSGAVTVSGAIAIGNTVQTAASVASTHKVTISIGGSTYYLLATNV